MRKFPDLKTHHYSPEALAQSIEQAHKAVVLDEHDDGPQEKVAKIGGADEALKDDDPKPSLTHATTHKSEPQMPQQQQETKKAEPKEKKESVIPQTHPTTDKHQQGPHTIDFEKIAE